jgi:hypothetical protein
MKGTDQDGLILKEIAACFPEWSGKTEKLYLKNKDFREAVQDYIFCKHKITRLSEETNNDRTLIELYEETMKELEKDMIEYLSM